MIFSGEVITVSKLAASILLRMQTIPANIIYHSYPIIKEKKVISAGPTTTQRFEEIDRKFIEKFRIRVIIGKGDISPSFQAFLCSHNVSYWEYPGGCGALAASFIKKKKNITPSIKGVDSSWLFYIENMKPVSIRF